MPEITIKYRTAKTLQALRDISKYFDFTIENQNLKNIDVTEKEQNLPITFAKNPDVTALAGIWKDRAITLETLRQKAWGDRGPYQHFQQKEKVN